MITDASSLLFAALVAMQPAKVPVPPDKKIIVIDVEVWLDEGQTDMSKAVWKFTSDDSDVKSGAGVADLKTTNVHPGDIYTRPNSIVTIVFRLKTTQIDYCAKTFGSAPYEITFGLAKSTGGVPAVSVYTDGGTTKGPPIPSSSGTFSGGTDYNQTRTIMLVDTTPVASTQVIFQYGLNVVCKSPQTGTPAVVIPTDPRIRNGGSPLLGCCSK